MAWSKHFTLNTASLKSTSNVTWFYDSIKVGRILKTTQDIHFMAKPQIKSIISFHSRADVPETKIRLDIPKQMKKAIKTNHIP